MAVVTRREFAAAAATTLASIAFGACDAAAGARQGRNGRMSARPKKGVTTTASGTRPLGLDRRDAILQMPDAPEGHLPLLLLLHGAGGSGALQLRRLGDAAREAGLAVLAPDSRGSTWDVIAGRAFGADVEFIDRALARVFDEVAVDPARITVAGFSDGATYALSLGVTNGALFSRILAFSPGFLVPGDLQGKPRVFVSHGTADRVLPIDRCSRALVPQLRKHGYDVTYREFEGGHTVPPDIARDGLRWAAAR